MLAPFEHAVESVAVVVAHGGLQKDNGNRIYAVSAVILTPEGKRKEFTSLIRYAHFSGRDRLYSNLSKDMLASAPLVAEVRAGLKAFLRGRRFVLVFDHADVLDEILVACDAERFIDLGFAAEFFFPQVGSSTPKSIWEHLHGKGRDKIHFHTGELAELSILLLERICSTILNDTQMPQAAAIRFYLDQSATLFGSFFIHLARHYKAYFSALFDVCTVQDTPYWQRFLKTTSFPKKKEPAEKESYKPVSPDQIDRLYKGMAESGKGFRFRPEQVQYGRHVAAALNDGAVLTIEAGTGTGKTQGYLIPAMEFLYRNKDARIAVSTYTKSLQEQIFQRELPFTKEVFKQYQDIPAALLKGKSSYLCAEKLDSVYEPGMHGKQVLSWLYFMNILFHFRDTDADSMGEKIKEYLNDDFSLGRLLKEISAKDGCSSKHLRCPAQVVTAEAAQARLVITNHHKLALLDSDGLLSGLFKNHIIDEANHFENAVRGAFGEEVESREVDGILDYIEQSLQKILTRAAGDHRRDMATALSIIAEVRGTMAELRDALLTLNPMLSSGESRELQYDHPSFHKGKIDQFIQSLRTDLKKIGKRIEFVEDENQCRLLKIQPRTALRMATAVKQLDEAAESLKIIADSILHRNQVSTYQLYRKHWILSAHSMDVAELIRHHFYRQKDCIVYTAATICHQDRFDCFRKITGQDLHSQPEEKQNEKEPAAKSFRFEKIPSPFSQDQMEISVHPEAVSGRYDNKEAWIQAVIAILPRLIKKNKGRTLVLFASYSDLELVAGQVAGGIINEGYPFLIQRPDVPTHKLCDEFRAIRESVLFGVDTFWYGVDFKGDTLTQVIITRMPFPPADSPMQLVRKRLMSPKDFWERYYYDADIKTKQGIGRLIRCDTDKGKVIFLDSRYKPEKNGKAKAARVGDERPKLFTIGHSTHSSETLIALLKMHQVDAVADVRSSPYSRSNPQFNRETFRQTLEKNQIAYRYLGQELGPRTPDPACHKAGKVSYGLLAGTTLFHQGLRRLRNGMAEYQIALLCAEQDPVACHRMILVCRQLRSDNLEILHILPGGSLESNEDAEKRMIHLLRMDHGQTLPPDTKDLVEQAYDIQGEKIAPVAKKGPSKK